MKYIAILFITMVTWSQAQVDCNNESTHSGDATYYTNQKLEVSGHCMLDESVIQPYYIGAMNHQDYALADYCGACVEIDGLEGSVKVHIVDECPECKPGDIDLSEEAFVELAPLVDGRIPITWKVVPCEISGSVKLIYKDGSNEYWTGIQVRNHRNPIEKLEFWDGSTYVDVPRQVYNYFLKSNGMGPGPNTFRITDIYGNSIIEKDIPFIIDQELSGKNQFPICIVTNLSEEIAVVQTVEIGEEILLLGEGNYQLFNTTGKVIDSGVANQKITIGALGSGIYILKIQMEDKIVVQRILVR